MLEIDLSNCQLFDVDKIKFSHKVNFVYGRNGTGKSTLVNIIAGQVPSEECHIFQGYDKVLGDNHKLNAVVLGEKNVEIDRNIKIIEEKINLCESKIQKIIEKITKTKDCTSNLWTIKEDAQQEFYSIKRINEKFYH